MDELLQDFKYALRTLTRCLATTTAAGMREVSPRSPAVYLAVSAASYFPARCATRVDPLLALRAE